MQRIWTGLVALLLGGAPPEPSTLEEIAWAGTWAMELRLASVAEMRFLPDQRSTTISRLLVELEHGPGGWVQRHRVCDVRVESSSAAFQMIVPRAFVHGLLERQYPVSFRSTPHGWSYAADLGVETIGLKPGFTGPELPRSADAADVQDTDRDGKPGATVQIHLPVAGRARLFIVQRSHLVLSGSGTARTGLRGAVDVRMQQQRTVGAEPALFRRSPTVRSDAKKSSFTLARVPGIATCEALRRAA